MLTKLAEKLVAEEMSKVAVAKWKEQLAGLSPESRASLAAIAKSEDEEVGGINRGTFRLIAKAGFTPKLVTKDSPDKDAQDLLRKHHGYYTNIDVDPEKRIVYFQDHNDRGVIEENPGLDCSTSRNMADALIMRHEALEAVEAAKYLRKKQIMGSYFLGPYRRVVGNHTNMRVLSEEMKLRNRTYHADKAEGLDKVRKDSGIASFLAWRTGLPEDKDAVYKTPLSNKDYVRMSDPRGHVADYANEVDGYPDYRDIELHYRV